jgi:uncharacterized protein (TIGR02001 family)
MKKTLLSLSIAAAAVSVPAQAADIGGGFDLSGNVAFVSDYHWRGMDQNGDSPAIQGGLDLAHDSGLYVGVWSSSAGGGGAQYSAEVDIYGGYAFEMAGVGVDVGAITYQYPGSGGNANFEELYLGLSKSFGEVELGVLFYEGTSTNEGGYELSAGTSLAGLSLSATYGEYDNTGDYYTVGVSKEILSDKWPVEIGLAYTEIDHDTPASDDDAVIFSVSKSF